MQPNDPPAVKPKLSRPTLPTLLSIAAALAAFGTVALHFLGEIAHRSYLQAWGIDSGIFPKTSDWLLVNGYYVLFDRFFNALQVAGNNLLIFFGVAVGAGLYVFILLSPFTTPAAAVSGWSWFRKRPQWFQRLLRQTFSTVLVIGLLPVALIVITAFMAIPAIVGETAGRGHAEREAVEFVKKCGSSKYSCVDITKDNKTIASGFILESSISHIAIFDADLNRSRVLSREGTQMLTRSLPTAVKN